MPVQSPIAQPSPEPEAAVLFQALVTPPRSLDARGMRLVAALILAASAAVALTCLALGAWPILGFTGLEAVLVLGLMTLHRRWSQRARELLVLTGAGLTIRRTDFQGRREELQVDPYWARLRLEERPGRVALLVLRRRGEAIEIGKLLGDEQKRDLAQDLGEALRRWRDPVFDNPQLRQ